MKALVTFTLSLFAVAFLSLAVVDDSDAKRMGGGKSFGSKNTFNQAASKPAPTQREMAATQQNTTQRAALQQRGGMMGMLGGLAIGGLLGALLFGGAFENINFMDILIFALIAFLLYKLFARKRQPAQRAYARPSDQEHDRPSVQPSQRSFDTDLMFKKDTRDTPFSTTSGGVASAPAMGEGSALVLPEGFDQKDFLQGAENAYRRLQKSWDEGNMDDIRRFTTDSVFAEIHGQLADRQGDNITELLKVETELLEAREIDGNTEASVLFDVVMRETDNTTQDVSRPYHVREIWHFTRPVNHTQPTWYLDGIQQIEQ